MFHIPGPINSSINCSGNANLTQINDPASKKIAISHVLQAPDISNSKRRRLIQYFLQYWSVTVTEHFTYSKNHCPEKPSVPGICLKHRRLKSALKSGLK